MNSVTSEDARGVRLGPISRTTQAAGGVARTRAWAKPVTGKFQWISIDYRSVPPNEEWAAQWPGN